MDFLEPDILKRCGGAFPPEGRGLHSTLATIAEGSPSCGGAAIVRRSPPPRDGCESKSENFRIWKLATTGGRQRASGRFSITAQWLAFKGGA